MTELQRTTILIVENDVLIRNLIGTVLSREGHLVLAAANNAEAVALSRSFRGEIRLLLATGTGIARAIVGERPAVRVILLSASTSSNLKEIVRTVSPGAFEQAALPRELSGFIRRALADPDFGSAFVEV